MQLWFLWFLAHCILGWALFSDWQYQAGTTGDDYVYGLAIDSNGPVVVGSTAGDLFGTNQGGTDWWLQRVSDAGSVLGQTQLGAANDDVARSLAVDANDNLWAAGWSGGPSPRTPFIFKMVPPGYGLDVYDHPSSSGTAFFGGITIDSTGNAIAVGGSTGTIDGLTSSGDYDFLLMVYSNAGVKQFTRLTGSSGQEDAYSVTTDSSDNIVVLGETSGSMSGFTNAGVGDDVVVLKYDSSGTLLWTYQWGSASDDWFKSVKTDSSDNIYAAGITAGTLTGANAGGYDMGVFKLNSAAVQQWVVQRGSAGTEQALSMALDLTNDLIYVSGKSDGELDGRTDTGTSAAFVMVFDLSGTWQSTSFFQGSGSSTGWGVALTASLDLIIAGHTDGSVGSSSNQGGNDYFLWKIFATSTTTTTISSSSTTLSTSSSVSSSSTTLSTSSTISSSSTTLSTSSSVSSSSTTLSTSSTISSSSTTLSTSSTVSSSSTTLSTSSSVSSSSTTLSTSSSVSSSSTTLSISSTISSSSTTRTQTSTFSTKTGSSATSSTTTNTNSATSISTSSTSTITTTRSIATSLSFTSSSSRSTTRTWETSVSTGLPTTSTKSTRNTHSVSSTSVSVSSTWTSSRTASTTLMMSSVSPATLTFTSTVTVTLARNVASEVLVNFEESQKDLVRQLLENAANETGVPVSTEEPDGTLVLGVAMSVPEDATDRITVSAPNGLSLAVPTTLLAAAGGSVTLSVAHLGQDSEMVQALEALENQTEELTSRLAARPVSVVLVGADGREWSGPLPAPLELVIPVPVVENQTEDGTVGTAGTCAFWDLETNMWSTEGVLTLSISNGLVTCETRHLSLFGFVLRTIENIFACSAAVVIFSLDGLKNLVKGGMWMWSIPALMHWAVILVAGIFLFASWRCDKKHERYLKELKQASEAHRFQQRLRLQRLQRRSSTMQLASLKQLLPEELIALRLPKVSRFSIHFYSMLVRQETGQTLADLEGLHSSVGQVAAHVKAYKCIIRFGSSSAFIKANTLYTANNAWVRWSEPSPVSSCVFRCLLHFALLYSKWAVAAVFFNASARAADANCEAFFQLSPEMIIRSVLVSIISTFVGVVPFILLVLLSRCPREPKCFTRVGNLIAFAYVWSYALTCIVVVSIFLSSVHPDDAWKWFVSGFVGFISSLFLIPIVLMSLGLALLNFYQVHPDDLCSWRKEGRLLRLQISMPPETRSLLQINGAEDLLVVCEVDGIPEKTVTLQKTGGALAWSSSRPFSIRDEQKLQISFRAGDPSAEDSELGTISLEKSEKWKGSRRLPIQSISLDRSEAAEAFVDVEVEEVEEVERDGMEKMVDMVMVNDGSNLPCESEVVDMEDQDSENSEETMKTEQV